ncbi:3'-5' exonuclease [Seleniivibrio woodruffii]|uniref:DNA polymerase-3 subunit epsilon n=1 Tax=Seleniivibrio woodruffii TaxID=1078050 RepID=A0A4R1K9J4_9BACT|nr:3'-5' exonuclease [Seleniivibrio woodruffii]TCK60533.1 DNA polymerase-3 subunit epsilon [Seleniivibrio woodruffii]TVZ36161.1 DNA polymerase-3 subunit epsilon [Seleniivibrio woodruffii]
MISKLFNKKPAGEKAKDPISIYVNKLCDNFAKNITLDERIEDTVFSVVDTETTGLDLATAKIINVAAVKVQNFKIIDFYNSFINPEIDIPAESIKWHNITNEMVEDKPTAGEVLPDFINFVGSSVIVGHHINFDIKMINKELNECYGCSMNNQWLDTMFIYSRAIRKKEEHVSLDFLLSKYQVVCNGRHTALGDALATAEVFAKMMSQSKSEFPSLRKLIDSQRLITG